MEVNFLKKFLNKTIAIENGGNGKGVFYGKLAGFKENNKKFCLSNLIIVRGGGITAPKYRNTRWFNTSKCNFIKEFENDQ
jgi:hypothetical protein